MLRKTVSGIMLTLLLIGMLTLAFNIQPVKAEPGTIYVRADGSIDPPTAPIQRDGDIYTFTDDIYDLIVVQKNNIIIDGTGKTVQGTGEYYSFGIDLSNRVNVTVRNTRITAFYYGIGFDESSNNTISGNNITNNEYGIYLSGSNNTVSGNSITANNEYGIYLSWSSNNTISGNNITANNKWGVFLCGSYNTVSGNNITENNNYGIDLYGSHDFTISGNNITANNSFGIGLDESSNNTVSGNSITNNQYGVHLSLSSYNTVSGNSITENNGDGIYIYESLYNSISGNNITANNQYGIHLFYSSSNSIIGNVFVNDGIYVYNSSYSNLVEGNVVNGKPLVYLEGVSYHTVSDAGQVVLVNCHNINVENLNLSNTLVGLELWATNNSKITNNNITANNQWGIYLYDSYSNKFYHNNLIENTRQVYDYSWDHPETPPSINTWDDGYPSGGNYWSNYDGSDWSGGPYQNEAGSDGIGDTAYSIAAYNKDRYPLMAPCGTFDSGTWNGTAYNVDIVGSSTVSGFQVNPAQKTIGFNVTGMEGTAGFCRITIPNIIVDDLWQGNYTVLLNGEPWPFTNWTDTTNTCIYVNYTHSEHRIIIIPEFPQALLLSLFMALSMLVSVLAKKKLLKKIET